MTRSTFHQLVLLLVFASLLLANSAMAQRPTVYRDKVSPNWISDSDSFWYQVKEAAGKSSFVLVNATTGTRAAAFDHAKVASLIADATSKSIDASNLPINTLEFSADLQQVTIRGGVGSWRVDLQTYEAVNLNTEPTSRSNFFLPPRRSIDKGGDVVFRFANELEIDVQLVWMDRSGGQVPYHNVKPGQSVEQHTFEGHVWLVKSAETETLAAFEVNSSVTDIAITRAALENIQKPGAERRREGGRSRRRSVSSQSPDGSASVTVRDHNLWLLRKDNSSPELQLSKDATEDNSFLRDASRTRLVEMQDAAQDAEPDARWSPDGRHVVAMQTTKVVERIVHFVESSPSGQIQPMVQSFSYAKPGDPLPISTPRLFHTDDGRESPIAGELFPDAFSLHFLKWSDDSSRFYLLYNERGHQALRVLEVMAADGSIRAVVDESSTTFIQYSSEGKYELHWLPNNQLLWASERSGWNHLYRYDLESGEVLNAVTSGDWNVRSIERIDPAAGVIWFYAVGVVADQDPYHVHFCRVNMDGSEFKVLTEGDGTHEITMSPSREFFIDSYSRVDLAPMTEYRRSSDGSLVAELEAGDASEIVVARGSLPIRFTAKGRDGQTDIWGIIHLPRYFDATKHYPVVENIYAGPHDHHVPKAFRSSYRHQHEIADQGIVVVQIDGMGTAWRSKQFHDVCFQNLKDAGFPDRIAWMKAASQNFGYMDISRVGIYGGSAGGQNAMAALLWHNTFYKVAVADCGCHDNRMDKIWWNEQWMGRLGEHYATNSNTENAHLMHGKLMLVVGELDRNVDPATTTQVVSKLIKAGKDFDFLLMPGVGHGACEQPYASRRRASFLARHLRSDSAAPE